MNSIVKKRRRTWSLKNCEELGPKLLSSSPFSCFKIQNLSIFFFLVRLIFFSLQFIDHSLSGRYRGIKASDQNLCARKQSVSSWVEIREGSRQQITPIQCWTMQKLTVIKSVSRPYRVDLFRWFSFHAQNNLWLGMRILELSPLTVIHCTYGEI